MNRDFQKELQSFWRVWERVKGNAKAEKEIKKREEAARHSPGFKAPY